MADTFGDVVKLPSYAVDTFVSDPEILKSTAGLVQDGGTFASGQGTIAAGTVVGRITSSGKFGPYATHSNEVQTLTIDATGGTFTLTFQGETTAAIAEDADSATVQAALVALSNIDSGDVTVTGDGPHVITFGGQYAGVNVDAIVTDATSLTGGAGTAVIAGTTAGGSAVSTGLETAVGVLRTGIETANGDTLGNIVFSGDLAYSKLTGMDANAIRDLNARVDSVFDHCVF